MPKYKIPIIGSGTDDDPQRPAQTFEKDAKIIEHGNGFIIIETKKKIEAKEGVEEIKEE